MSGEELRACSDCGDMTPLDAFAKYGQRGSGQRYRSRCKPCQAILDRTYRARYVERHRERLRPTWSEHNRRTYSPESNRALHATDHAKARQKLRNAVAAGTVVKASACEMCGATDRIQGHHHRGYDQALTVQWLCSICHGRQHRKGVAA